MISQVLRSELEKRVKVNHRYSMRAFSKFLGVDAPTLSKILNNKKVPKEKLSRKILDKLGYGPFEQARVLEFSKSHLGGFEDNEYHYLASDEYELISHWYYFAILELFELDDFQSSSIWMAKQLGLDLPIVEVALERLERLKMIRRDCDPWEDVTGGKVTSLGKHLTSIAMRDNQKEILELAIEALDNTPIELRNQTASTVAINKDDLPRAKEMIKHFKRKLAKLLSENGSKNEVYHISISMYPVTKVDRDEAD